MLVPPSPDFARLLATISQALRTRGISFMVIGGHAVLLHGQARLTEDIDITLDVGPDAFAQLRDVCAELSLVPLPEDAEGFVRETFVLPARDAASGVRVDFIFSTLPYEHQAIGRAESVEIHGVPVRFATAEDLIIHKLFAGRPRDREDAAGVVRRKGSHLDWVYLQTWVDEFACLPGREGLSADLAALRSPTAHPSDA
jgi:predicted nucleotidyltransferase